MLNELFERNGIDDDKISELIHQNILLKIFQQLIMSLEKKGEKLIFKKQILACCNINAEILIYKKQIQNLFQIKLSDAELLQIRKWMNASFTKSNRRVKIADRIKFDILKRQDNKCAICSSPISGNTTAFDHIIPFKFVGDEIEDNLQGLCVLCNKSKGSNPIEFFSRILNNVFK